MPTRASDVVAAAFHVLAPDEQEEAYRKIRELRLQAAAGTEAETARFIRGLARVQQEVDSELSVTDYRAIQPKLAAAGDEVPPLSQVLKHFGSWKRAKDALFLAEDETALKIDARFRARRVGKVHRYREEALREAIMRCAEFVGHPPLVVEFEMWRQRELELAQAQGQAIALPSSSPYRNRYGTWERALLHFGFTQEDIDGAHEASEAQAVENLRPYHYRVSS